MNQEKNFLRNGRCSSEFYNKETGKYDLAGEGRTGLSSEELVTFYEELCNEFPIISIEDGLDENDWDGTNY